MTEPKNLSGKIALVTGGTRGIGRAISLKLAGLGAHIILNYLDREKEARETLSLIESGNGTAELLPANLAHLDNIKSMADTLHKKHPRLDLLIHSAALGTFKNVIDLRQNQWDLSFDINTKAFLWLVQKLSPLMPKQSSIVAISSTGAQRYVPSYGAVGISKAALENLVRYLAVELAARSIRVNAVSGGLIDTESLNAFPHLEMMKKETIRRTPQGRLGTPEDIANVVAFLCQEDSSWILGQTLIADGGYSLT